MAIDLTDIAAGNGGFVVNGFENGAAAGRSVARLGDVNGDGFDDFAVGSPQADGGIGNNNRGEVYVVFGTDQGFASSVELSDIAAGTGGFVIRGTINNQQAGFSLSSAGDMNGDGFADIVIGSPYVANGGSNRGSTYVVFGAGSSLASGVNLSDVAAGTGGFVVAGFENNAFFGDAVAGGDFNGDGFGDILMGAPYTNSGGSDRGVAYLVFGTNQGFAASTNVTAIAAGTGGFSIRGNENTASFGYSVDFAGDINGDGFDDLVVGARRGDSFGSDRGATYVVFGGSGNFSAGIAITDILVGNGGFAILGFENSARSGQSVAAAGDFNGDGIDDLIIGAPLTDSGGNNRGAAYVVYGTDQGFAATISLSAIASGTGGFVITGTEDAAQAGFDVSSAGDINGDGFDDILIGAYLANSGGTSRGAVYVLFGNGLGIPAANVDDLANGIGGFAIAGIEDGAQSGRAVSSAGDINDDGFDDLLIGAPATDSGGSDRGAAYVVFGSASIGGFVNDAPVNTVPGAQTVDEEASLAISGLSIADADAYFGPLTVTLSVANGTLVVASAGGAAVANSGTGTVTLTGTIAEINTTLAAASNVSYAGALDFFGSDTLTVTTDDDGNTGSGGGETDTDQVAITVTSVNDAPTGASLENVVNALPENASTVAARKIADIAVIDVDGGNTQSLSGADAALFEIVGSALYLKAGAQLDFKTNPQLDVSVNVDDPSNGLGIDFTRTLTLAVGEVADAGEDIVRGDGNNTINGSAGDDWIRGGAGNDRISGHGGDDRIIGGPGTDIQTGGAGADTFVFRTINQSGGGQSGIGSTGRLTASQGQGDRDIITDFRHNLDRIDLLTIDANTRVAGNQAFSWRGTGETFTNVAGQLIAKQHNAPGTTNDKTIVYGDVNGDGRGDFQIEFTGLHTLTRIDFVL